jgi:ferrous iron transport protein B
VRTTRTRSGKEAREYPTDRRLVDLGPGETGAVRGLQGGRNLVARLAALGFTIGVPVKVIRRNLNGPLLVSLRGVDVALGYGEAARVCIGPASAGEPAAPARSTGFTIALAGQPNVGKSTVFNLLTGLSQHVGNWAGKTVEKKSGTLSYKGASYAIVDLPGTYSLSANSEEELIARDFILKEKPSLVVAVVDAATLERNLYLVAELLLLPSPVLLALNMMDVAEREGITVEPRVLETALGIPVVPMAASRGRGNEELKAAIERMLGGRADYHPNLPAILPAHQPVLDGLREMVVGYVPEVYPADWVALKLLEGDEEISAVMRRRMPADDWKAVGALLYRHEDAVLDIAGARYHWIGRMVRAAVVEPPASRMGRTERADRVLTHALWGNLALVAALGAVFFLTFSVGGPLQSALSGAILALGDDVRSWLAGAPRWIAELVAGGLLGGLGMVLTFLPILTVFYVALGFLEDTGYMARAAYLTDRFMHMMGLHGKSFLPILLGFGCNVPAVLGTRIIESRRARLQTILLVPFVPCTARMAVVAILAPVFFGGSAFWVTWGLVGGNVVLLGIIGFVLHRFVFEDEHVPFIMELPLYHMPNPKTIGIYVWQNLVGFLRKAGSVILVAAMIVWAFSYFPTGDIATSWLGQVGKGLQPAAALLGLPWQVLIALLTSFAAKENTIATLSVLYGDIASALPAVVSTAAGLGLLAFQMLFVPCVGTIAAIRSETRSLAWTVLSVGLMAVLSFVVAFLLYRLGRLL